MRRKIIAIRRAIWDELLAIDEAFATTDVLVTSACFFVLVAVIDWLTSYELSLNPFYLLIIMFVTWRCGWKWGLAFAFGALGNQVAIGLMSGNPFSRLFYFVLANCERLFSSLITIALLTQLRMVRRHTNGAMSEKQVTALGPTPFSRRAD